MRDAPGPPTVAYAGFAVLAMLLLAATGWTIAREMGSEWRVVQRRFADLARTTGAAAEGSRGVRQIWLPDLDRADRCTTCHLGIDDSAMIGAPQPFTAHSGRWMETHPPERFGCTSCHAGQGEATTWRDAGHGHLPHWPQPIRRHAFVEAGCGACHRERHVPGAPLLSAGRELIAAAGCAACHEVPGFDDRSVRAPQLASAGHKLAIDWIRRHLAPGGNAGTRMPDFRLDPGEIDDLAWFLRAQRAAVPPGSEGVNWSAADAARGREIFARARCVTCHTIDERGGTVGPDLSHVGSKVSRPWLWSFIADPERDQPDTLMPRFRFTRGDQRDLVTYLSRELVDPAVAPAAPPDAAPPAGAVERGWEIFRRRGCSACHTLRRLPSPAKIGPSLAGIGDRPVGHEDLGDLVRPSLANLLYLKLRAPERLGKAALMPSFALSDADRLAIAVALLSESRRAAPPVRTTADSFNAQRPVQGPVGGLMWRYRCLTCHTLRGEGGGVSTVALDRVGSQLQPAYLRSFLLTPHAVRVHLDVRMPKMGLTTQEADLFTDYATRVLIDDRIAPWAPPPDDGIVARGEGVYERLGCRSCHSIRGTGGYVGPNLTTVGRRLKAGWVRAWLTDPTAWKPGTLQPVFELAAEEADALTAYLMSQRGQLSETR